MLVESYHPTQRCLTNWVEPRLDPHWWPAGTGPVAQFFCVVWRLQRSDRDRGDRGSAGIHTQNWTCCGGLESLLLLDGRPAWVEGVFGEWGVVSSHLEPLVSQFQKWNLDDLALRHPHATDQDLASAGSLMVDNVSSKCWGFITFVDHVFGNICP